MRRRLWWLAYRLVTRAHEKAFLLEDCYADRLSAAMARMRLWTSRGVRR